MKIFLRLMGGLSAVSSQLSDMTRYIRGISKLKPTVFYLLPRKEISAVSHQPSELGSRSSALKRRLPTLCLLSPNTYKQIPILLFILVFVSCSAALAQEQGVHTAPAAKAESGAIDPIFVGSMLPEGFWDQEHLIYQNGDTVKGNLRPHQDKLLILDFWATWCGSCIINFSNLEEIQARFKDDLSIVLINSIKTRDTFERINLLMAGKKMPYKIFNLASIIDDKIVLKYFPNRVIPHYVWIIDNQVRAITTSEMVTENNIERMLERSIKLQASKNVELNRGGVR